MANTTLNVVIQARSDIEENWSLVNPVLAKGEFGYTTDTKKLKLGDGSTKWNDLQEVNKDVSWGEF